MWRFVKKHRETGIEVTLGTWNLLADAEAAASRFGLDCKRYSYRLTDGWSSLPYPRSLWGG
jgi:hypothetical protein